MLFNSTDVTAAIQYDGKLRERDDAILKLKRESENNELTISQMRIQLDQAYTTLAGMVWHGMH